MNFVGKQLLMATHLLLYSVCQPFLPCLSAERIHPSYLPLSPPRDIFFGWWIILSDKDMLVYVVLV